MRLPSWCYRGVSALVARLLRRTARLRALPLPTVRALRSSPAVGFARVLGMCMPSSLISKPTMSTDGTPCVSVMFKIGTDVEEATTQMRERVAQVRAL